MLQNEYFVAKIGFARAENEPSKIWQLFGNICGPHSRALALEALLFGDQSVSLGLRHLLRMRHTEGTIESLKLGNGLAMLLLST